MRLHAPSLAVRCNACCSCARVGFVVVLLTFAAPTRLTSMCAPRAERGAALWLNESLAMVSTQSAPSGVHYNVWTWKGDVVGDASSMSFLEAPSRGDRFNLNEYVVDQDVYELFRQHFQV